MPYSQHLYYHNYHNHFSWKVLCRCIMNYNQIEISIKFLNDQVGSWLIDKLGKNEGVEFIFWEGIVGAVLAIALKYRGSSNSDARWLIEKLIYLISNMKKSQKKNEN